MKKKVRVIRTAKQTVVIYSEQTREKGAAPQMGQRAVPVYHNGKKIYWIMPDGRYLPVKTGFFWRVLKFIRPRSQFAV